MSWVERWWKEGCFLRFEAKDDLNGKIKDYLDPFIVEIYLPSHVVGNKDELY